MNGCATLFSLSLSRGFLLFSSLSEVDYAGNCLSLFLLFLLSFWAFKGQIMSFPFLRSYHHLSLSER